MPTCCREAGFPSPRPSSGTPSGGTVAGNPQNPTITFNFSGGGGAQPYSPYYAQPPLLSYNPPITSGFGQQPGAGMPYVDPGINPDQYWSFLNAFQPQILPSEPEPTTGQSPMLHGSVFSPYNNGDYSTMKGGPVGPYFSWDATPAVARIYNSGSYATGIPGNYEAISNTQPTYRPGQPIQYSSGLMPTLYRY